MPGHSLRIPTRALAVAAAALLAAAPAEPAGHPFTFDVVEAPAGGARHPSLTLDAAGNPRVLYHDVANRQLRYAEWRGAAWAFETVDTLVGDLAYGSSLVLDAAGNPHASYWDRALRLRYARRGTDGWEYQSVDSTYDYYADDIETGTTLRLDPQGAPRILYQQTHSYREAWSRAGRWFAYDVDFRPPTDPWSWGYVRGNACDFAFGRFGSIHYVFQDEDRGDLCYRQRDSGVEELVDSTGDVGHQCRIAVDASGVPHVAYHDRANNRIRYGTRPADAWIVEETGLEGGEPSIALDSWGFPAIAYRRSDGQLGYARRGVAAWSDEVVDPRDPNGALPSLAFDRHDNPHIAYEGTATGDLRLADTALHLLSPIGGEAWGAETIQPIRWRGMGAVSVRLSPDAGATYPIQYFSTTADHLNASLPAWSTETARCLIIRVNPYSESVSPGLFTITSDTTGVTPFVTEIVDSLDDPGEFASMALDSRGEARIAYLAAGGVRYAVREGARWRIEQVGSGEKGVTWVAHAVDALDNAHVVYLASGPPIMLRYARRGAAGWTDEPIPPPLTEPVMPSIAVDRLGNPTVAFVEWPRLALHVATRRGGTWTAEPVAGGVLGIWPFLQVDAAGEPHVAYVDPRSSSPWYAARRDGAWTAEMIDPTPYAGYEGVSLALGPGGVPAVAYHRLTTNTLIFATRAGGAWVSDPVRPVLLPHGPEPGWRPSLALDATGVPSIAWYTGGLNFARPGPLGWRVDTVDSPSAGKFASLALDREGNPLIAYRHGAGHALALADAAVHLLEPAGGERWQPGGTATVRWSGLGPVDVYLSPDDGATWTQVASGVSGGSAAIAVPDWWSTRVRARVERAEPRSTSQSRSAFSIAPNAGPRFALRAPFPNPRVGRGPGTFPLSMPAGATIRLRLYDAQGRLVASSPQRQFSVGGLYPLDWDPGDIPAGVYFVSATGAAGETAQAKWVRLR